MAQRKRRPVRQPELEADEVSEFDDEVNDLIDDEVNDLIEDLDLDPSPQSTRVLTDGTVVDADEEEDEEAEEFEEEPDDTDATIPSIERDEDFEREVEEEIRRPVEEFIQEFSDPAITSDPVRMYLREIGRTALLTGDEEIFSRTRFTRARLPKCGLPANQA